MCSSDLRMRYWFEHERLPEDWKPYHTTSLTQTVITVSRIRDRMHLLERENKKKAKTATKTEEVVAPQPVSVAVPETAPAPLSIPESPVALTKAEAEKKPVSVSDGASSDSDIDDGAVVRVPHLIRESSVASATDSEFSTLHTPQASEFATHPYVATKDGDAYELRLPDIDEHVYDQKGVDVAHVDDVAVVAVGDD